jgi:hypothetical protein
LRWLLPFSARVHPSHSTRHQRPSSLWNTTSFQCPSAILHRFIAHVAFLPSNSDMRVSTAFPSLSLFTDIRRIAILTSHLGSHLVFNHTHAVLAAGLARTFPFPWLSSSIPALAPSRTSSRRSRSDDALLQNKNEAIRATVYGGARAPCVAQSYHGMTLHDTL